MIAGQRWTRRAMAASLAAAAAGAVFGKSRRLPAEWEHFEDPATEHPLIRLTSPEHSSHLTSCWNRAVSRRGDFLLFWSDRTGSPQAFQMDLKSGEFEQATSARDLDGTTLALLPDDKSFCCFDGVSLRLVRLSGFRAREIYRVPEGWRRGRGFSLAPNGSHCLLVETRGPAWRLRMVAIPKGTAQTLLESPEPLSAPVGSPDSKAILYRRKDSLWTVGYDGGENRRLEAAPGRTGPAFWSPSASSILYLNFPEDRTVLNSIREYDLSQNTDRLVSTTTQYAHFAPNADASVFAGASGSVASPYVLLLFRATRRELAICEHRASRPGSVAPVFSPGSQSIFFESDRHGKPAIYSTNVESLVERTEV